MSQFVEYIYYVERAYPEIRKYPLPKEKRIVSVFRQLYAIFDSPLAFAAVHSIQDLKDVLKSRQRGLKYNHITEDDIEIACTLFYRKEIEKI